MFRTPGLRSLAPRCASPLHDVLPHNNFLMLLSMRVNIYAYRSRWLQRSLEFERLSAARRLRAADRIAARLLAIFAGMIAFGHLSTAHSQPFPENADAGARQRLILDRVVTIEVTAHRNDNDLPETAYGNGTIISPAGMVITAKHVIDAFPSNAYGPSTYKVIHRTANSRQEYELAPYDIEESARYDAVTVPIKNEGAQTFPYLCISPAQVPVGSALEMQSFVFYDKVGGQPVNEWRLKPRPTQPVLAGKSGFGDFARYWSVNTDFAESESGAGILHDNELLGIVAKSLVYQKGNVAVPIEGHQYFVPVGLVFNELALEFIDTVCEREPAAQAGAAESSQTAETTECERLREQQLKSAADIDYYARKCG